MSSGNKRKLTDAWMVDAFKTKWSDYLQNAFFFIVPRGANNPVNKLAVVFFVQGARQWSM